MNIYHYIDLIKENKATLEDIEKFLVLIIEFVKEIKGDYSQEAKSTLLDISNALDIVKNNGFKNIPKLDSTIKLIENE